jgi:hypothetical protein
MIQCQPGVIKIVNADVLRNQLNNKAWPKQIYMNYEELKPCREIQAGQAG